jgi:hypothetical protein
MDKAARTEILALERGLLDPATRHLPEWLDRIFAEDLTEFGQSGRAYTKDEIIQALVAEKRAPVAIFAIAEPRFTELAPGVVLVTYRREPLVQDSVEPPVASLRASIWRNDDGRWRLFFHQGTAIG